MDGLVDLDAILQSESHHSEYPGLPSDVARRAWEALESEDPEPLCGPPTLGTERIAWAPFAIESSKPRKMTVLGYDMLNGINRPDRSEYYWQKIGNGGPADVESELNLQEFSLYHETGTDSVSAFFRIPLRMLDPQKNPNTTGLGTLEIGTKTVLFEGDDFFWIPTHGLPSDRFRMSTVMRTQLSLGPSLARRGLQNGHTALEPGLLFSYEICPDLVFHGETKYWVPLGGKRGFAGQILRWGGGVSYVFGSSPVDTVDCRPWAIIPTLELHGSTYLDGQETLSSGFGKLDGDAVVNISPGVRVSLGETVDLGLAGTWNLTRRRIADNALLIQLRFLW